MEPLADPYSADLRRLEDTLRSIPSAIVAFSGGVDSAVVTAVAARVIPRLLAVTAASPAYAQADIRAATELCARLGIAHETIQTRETDDERYAVNQPTRCFHCKTELYGKLDVLRRERGMEAVLDGTHAGDLSDFRPGMAAADQWRVRSPLREANLDKPAIRAIAQLLNLRIWNKPASPCLASRFPYGETITIEKLSRVERAEAFLHAQGFGELRVRHHGNVARIEVAPQAMPQILERAQAIVDAFREIGYAYVALDLAGFRSGSLNEVLSVGVRSAT